jgi:hypothetical protein
VLPCLSAPSRLGAYQFLSIIGAQRPVGCRSMEEGERKRGTGSIRAGPIGHAVRQCALDLLDAGFVLTGV